MLSPTVAEGVMHMSKRVDHENAAGPELVYFIDGVEVSRETYQVYGDHARRWPRRFGAGGSSTGADDGTLGSGSCGDGASSADLIDPPSSHS